MGITTVINVYLKCRAIEATGERKVNFDFFQKLTAIVKTRAY
jgi:hypothetical protein